MLTLRRRVDSCNFDFVCSLTGLFDGVRAGVELLSDSNHYRDLRIIVHMKRSDMRSEQREASNEKREARSEKAMRSAT
jgi:hypothetical protein